MIGFPKFLTGIRLALLFVGIGLQSPAGVSGPCDDLARVKSISRLTVHNADAAFKRVAESVVANQTRLIALGVRPELLPNLILPETEIKNIKGIAVVVHGRGQSPKAMRSVSRAITEGNVAVLEVLLTGHGTKDPDRLAGVTLNDWLGDVSRGLALARTIGLPVKLVGYSLGGGIALHVASDQAPDLPLKTVLIAPAITMESTYAASIQARIRAGKIYDRDIAEGASRLSSIGYSIVPLASMKPVSSLLETLSAPDFAQGMRGKRLTIVVSAADSVVSVDGAMRLGEIAGATVVVLPADRHVTHGNIIKPMQIPEEVITAVSVD